MKELRTDIAIAAPADRVWAILTDFSSFPDWNPFMLRAQGNVKVGETIEVYLKLPDGMGMTFKPTVLATEPNRGFRWKGRTVMPGIFDGEHIFEIEESGDGSCRFVQREQFTGILTSLMLRFIGKKTLRGFEIMNTALKARAEAAPETDE